MSSRSFDILLVDDSRADRRFITRELSRNGSYQVDTAETVACAREKLSCKNYDCVLLDYNLPDSDGLSLMEGLPSPNHTGIVMITGEGNEQIAAQAIKMGANEYISKNQINGKRLSLALDRAIEHSRARRTRDHQQLVMENFASSAAHDLANPLSGLIGFLSLSQKCMEDGQQERVPEFLANAMTSALYMKQLVADLLHYARTGTSVDAAVTLDLNESAQTAVNVLAETIEQSGATIRCADLPSVEAYPTEMVQLFQNLIANSIKYCSDKPPVIDIYASRDGDRHIITVADNGLGIPEQSRKAIFTPLFRLHNKNVEGSGLGLATCTKIMDLHRGEIWCEGREGGGSLFHFSLHPTLQDN